MPDFPGKPLLHLGFARGRGGNFYPEGRRPRSGDPALRYCRPSTDGGEASVLLPHLDVVAALAVPLGRKNCLAALRLLQPVVTGPAGLPTGDVLHGELVHSHLLLLREHLPVVAVLADVTLREVQLVAEEDVIFDLAGGL